MNAKEILQKALERIRTVGWRNDGGSINSKGFWESPAICDGPLCVLNTLVRVGGVVEIGSPRTYIYRALGRHNQSIAYWNDTPGRTKEDVEKLLEKAIALAEADR